MMIFRRAYEEDLAGIYALAKLNTGLTTLPHKKSLLKKRVDWSCASFEKNVNTAVDEYYLFVLEDTSTKKIVGTSAIEAAVGSDVPFYSYKLTNRMRISHDLGVRSEYKVLNLVNDYHGSSELCTLYLDKSSRKGINGTLLSRARFLFMAHTPQRFAKTIIAEIRGCCDDDGLPPFWKHVTGQFFQIPFQEADDLTITTNKQFIADLMPRNPIYIPLLHQDAQAVIGKPHPLSAPAMHILMKEGFKYNKYIDIFDAGPTIEADFYDITTIRQTKILKIIGVLDSLTTRYQSCFLAKPSCDFKALIGNISVLPDNQTCYIDTKVAKHLQVEAGSPILAAPISLSVSKDVTCNENFITTSMEHGKVEPANP